MRKRLQIALMASTVAATSFFVSPTPQLFAEGGEGPSQSSSQKITASDEHGRKVYVNDSVAPAPAHAEEAPPRRTLMYWSSKENRWRPVPPPNAATMRAARSAAAEVNQYLGHESNQSATAKIVAANFGSASATVGDIDSAIE